jgi:hypothetical protein
MLCSGHDRGRPNAAVQPGLHSKSTPTKTWGVAVKAITFGQLAQRKRNTATILITLKAEIFDCLKANMLASSIRQQARSRANNPNDPELDSRV